MPWYLIRRSSSVLLSGLALVALCVTPTAVAATKKKPASKSREAVYRCHDANGQAHFGQSIPAVCIGRDIEVAAGSAEPGETITIAVRPEKIHITRERPDTSNAVEGVVNDLGYFGKDSLYRVSLPSGVLVSVDSVNVNRGKGARVAEWEDKVWLYFDPSAAILLSIASKCCLSISQN